MAMGMVMGEKIMGKGEKGSEEQRRVSDVGGRQSLVPFHGSWLDCKVEKLHNWMNAAG